MATLREELEELDRLVRILGREIREASRIDAIAAAVDRWVSRRWR